MARRGGADDHLVRFVGRRSLPAGGARSSRSLRSFRAKETKRARITVKERRRADGADLAVAEETAERRLRETFGEQSAIVVRPSVEMFAASEAGEEEGAGG